MMVKAIGPQNALSLSGIIARIAASAVSATGRARRMVENTIASRRVRPRSLTSASIWSIRITVLRMSMPASAIRPEQRDEAERLPGEVERDRGADDAERAR